MKIRAIYYSSLLICATIIIFAACGSKDEAIFKLTESQRARDYAYAVNRQAFDKVESMNFDKYGNLYILDTGKLAVQKFDSSGTFIKTIVEGGEGFGSIYKPCSVNLRDSLLFVHNVNALAYYDLNGRYKDIYAVSGRADIVVSEDSMIIVNRMSDAFQYKKCLFIYNKAGNLVSNIIPTRSKAFRRMEADFAFVGALSGRRFVYVPALLDSIFLYDYNGNILKAAYLRHTFQKNKLDADSLMFEIEDIFVQDDKIYLLRVERETSTDQLIYVKRIELYDANLRLNRIYELPHAITMTVNSSPWALAYHKFLVRDNMFIFMVSKPQEHLAAFEPEQPL
ncbi:hypothetical protein JXJ21_00115 [candidate division KSB1 bacterium]|nr:hypothetical protein [candidate division KSB1 bacterium]